MHNRSSFSLWVLKITIIMLLRLAVGQRFLLCFSSVKNKQQGKSGGEEKEKNKGKYAARRLYSIERFWEDWGAVIIGVALGYILF